MVEFFGELKEKLGQVQSPGKYPHITQQRRSVLPFSIVSLRLVFWRIKILLSQTIGNGGKQISLRLLASLAAKGTLL